MLKILLVSWMSLKFIIFRVIVIEENVIELNGILLSEKRVYFSDFGLGEKVGCLNWVWNII